MNDICYTSIFHPWINKFHPYCQVAIPGAVVRLPQGVTPQQLQMMSPNERQTFLQNLHQKQMQEQQAREKPRAGKPPGPQVNNIKHLVLYRY